MSDAFYKLVRFAGRTAFWPNTAPVVLGERNVRRQGAYIVAATHSSAYDVPLLMRHVERPLDFVSITEVFADPLIAWFYGSLNAFPLDRHKPDSPTVRIILDRLARKRVVAMFPEGGMRHGQNAVYHSRRIRPGIGRLSLLSRAPIVPCVILNSGVFSRPASWIPLADTRYGIAFGEPIFPTGSADQIEQKLVDAYVEGFNALTPRMSRRYNAQSNHDPRKPL